MRVVVEMAQMRVVVPLTSDADVCWRMLSCWRMLTYADVCWRMPDAGRDQMRVVVQLAQMRVVPLAQRQQKRQMSRRLSASGGSEWRFVCAFMNFCIFHSRILLSFDVCSFLKNKIRNEGVNVCVCLCVCVCMCPLLFSVKANWATRREWICEMCLWLYLSSCFIWIQWDRNNAIHCRTHDSTHIKYVFFKKTDSYDTIPHWRMLKWTYADVNTRWRMLTWIQKKEIAMRSESI